MSNRKTEAEEQAMIDAADEVGCVETRPTKDMDGKPVVLIGATRDFEEGWDAGRASLKAEVAKAVKETRDKFMAGLHLVGTDGCPECETGRVNIYRIASECTGCRLAESAEEER